MDPHDLHPPSNDLDNIAKLWGKKIQLLYFYNKIKITIIELKVEESTQKRAERDYVYYVTYPATV